MTEKSIEQTLKEELRDSIYKVEITRENYLAAKAALHKKQAELNDANYNFGQGYKNWKNARKEAIRAKRRLQSQPYRTRKWVLANIGKAYDRMIKDV